MMDDAITEECDRQKVSLDFESLKYEFEQNSHSAADNHVIETLFTILDFHKFKELMVAYNSKDAHNEVQQDANGTDKAEIEGLVEKLVQDGKVLLESKDSNIWKVHTKVSEERIAYESKEITHIQPKLQVMQIKNKIWKFDIILPNID